MPGVAPAPAVVSELQRQLNHELGAAQSYLALAIWCEDQNLKGFARFFKKQAGEEREHAERMMRHLLDRAVLPEVRALPAPRGQFASLLEVAKHVQAMERANTQGIHACYEAALGAKDYAAKVMLQWFIQEQVEEEAWTDEMVERVESADCPGGRTELDRHLERHLNHDVIGEEEAKE